MESIFTSFIIDAHEGRDVAIFGVPGAYLNADTSVENVIILKMEGEFVDIMCEENPQHKKCTYENGVKVIYIQVLNEFMDAWSPHYYGMTCTKNCQNPLD